MIEKAIACSQRYWHSDIPILHTFWQTGAGVGDEMNRYEADILKLY